MSCPSTALAPGAAMTCTAAHTVIAADVTGSQVVNSAVARGMAGTQTVVSQTATASVPVGRPAQPTPPIPGTGGNVGPFVGVGGMVLALGLVMVATARGDRTRRRGATA